MITSFTNVSMPYVSLVDIFIAREYPTSMILLNVFHKVMAWNLKHVYTFKFMIEALFSGIIQ